MKGHRVMMSSAGKESNPCASTQADSAAALLRVKEMEINFLKEKMRQLEEEKKHLIQMSDQQNIPQRILRSQWKPLPSSFFHVSHGCLRDDVISSPKLTTRRTQPLLRNSPQNASLQTCVTDVLRNKEFVVGMSSKNQNGCDESRDCIGGVHSQFNRTASSQSLAGSPFIEGNTSAAAVTIELAADYNSSRNSNGIVPPRRTSFLSVETDMPTLRRNNLSRLRPNTSDGYELSQDLQEKQMEMLMNKYGGRERTQHAVRLIQAKYREYRMRRNFEKMICDKRNSRRIEQQRSLSTTTAADRMLRQASTIQKEIPIAPQSRTTGQPISRKYLYDADDGLANDQAFLEWQMSREAERDLASIKVNSKAGAEQDRSSCVSETSSQISTGETKAPPNVSLMELSPHLHSRDCSFQRHKKLPRHQKQSQHHLFSLDCHSTALPDHQHNNHTDPLLNVCIHTSRDSGVDAVGDISPTSGSAIIAPPITTISSSTHCASVLAQGHASFCKVHQLQLGATAIHDPSPVWKRKLTAAQPQASPAAVQVCLPYQQQVQLEHHKQRPHNACCHFRSSDKHRKRIYRVGLNLFNKKPERGIEFLMRHHFIDPTAQAVAQFLLYRKGLAKEMVGLFLCNHSQAFNKHVLHLFVEEMDFRDKPVDVAVREFCSLFEMKGEAQIIERVLTVFAKHYERCNSAWVAANFSSSTDSVLMIAYSVMMLNTDLHKGLQSKTFSRMTKEQYVQNLLRTGDEMDEDYLRGIYDRIALEAMVGGSDHVTQVRKVEASMVGDHPPLAQAHRRLVCFCKLYEVSDVAKRDKVGSHERAIFLFNDIILVSKVLRKKKDKTVYQYRNHFSLVNVKVLLFESPYHKYGIQLTSSLNLKQGLLSLNARNQHDRSRFAEDLQESVLEMEEMEALRIEEELGKQTTHNRTPAGAAPAVHHCTSHKVEAESKQEASQSSRLPINRFSGDSGLQIDLESLAVTH